MLRAVPRTVPAQAIFPVNSLFLAEWSDGDIHKLL